MKWARVTALTVAITAAACAPQEPEMEMETAAPDPAATLASLHEADAAYASAASARDLDAWMALYTDDSVLYPPEGAATVGLDAIRERFSGFVDDPNSTARFELLRAEVAPAGDMGYTMNLAITTGTGGDGEVTTSRIRDFHVWRRVEDGSWRIIIDMWAPAEPADRM